MNRLFLSQSSHFVRWVVAGNLAALPSSKVTVRNLATLEGAQDAESWLNTRQANRRHRRSVMHMDSARGGGLL